MIKAILSLQVFISKKKMIVMFAYYRIRLEYY